MRGRRDCGGDLSAGMADTKRWKINSLRAFGRGAGGAGDERGAWAAGCARIRIT